MVSPGPGCFQNKRSGDVNFKRWTYTTALVILGAASFAIVDPPPSRSQAVEIVKVDVTVVAGGVRVSKLIGSDVVNEKNETIGSIDDIIVDRNRVLFTVLQVGGFLGLGAHLVAVPYDALKVDGAKGRIELPGASRDELEKLAEFKYRD